MIEFTDFLARDLDGGGKVRSLPRKWIRLEGKCVGWVDLKPGHPVFFRFSMFDYERQEVAQAVKEEFGESPAFFQEPTFQAAQAQTAATEGDDDDP